MIKGTEIRFTATAKHISKSSLLFFPESRRPNSLSVLLTLIPESFLRDKAANSGPFEFLDLLKEGNFNKN